MKNDKELLNELNDLLDNFKNELDQKKSLNCEKEIMRIRGIFNHAASRFQSSKRELYSREEESPFLEILLTLKNVMKSIDDEARLLEKEMNGVANYSDYQYMKTMDFACKKALKEELIKMLRLIRSERPELKGKEPFISI